MTPKQADQLVANKATIVLVDVYGDHGVVQVVSRDCWCITNSQGQRFDRTSIVEFHQL